MILLGIVISALAFWVVRDNERNATRHAFEQKVQVNVTAIRLAIERGIESLESSGTLFDSAENITRSQFRAFGQRALSRNRALLSVAWTPLVPGNRRQAFESAAQREVPGFAIRDLDAKFQLVSAAMREEYFPIYYMETDGGRTPIGLDTRRSSGFEAVARSKAFGSVGATGRIKIATGPFAGKTGFALFRPVYRRGVPSETPEQRNANIVGFTHSIFLISSQINELLERVGSPGVRVVLYDDSAPAGERFLAIWPEAEQKDPAAGERAAPPPILQSSVALDVGGRTWVAVFTPEAGNFSTAASWHAWAALTTGVLFSILLASYLGSLLKYAQSVKQQALSDVLTGLYNRRYLAEFLQRELILAGRRGTRVAAVMLDIDFFKHINDGLGHEAGDLVLAELGALLRKGIRGSDIAFRYGGEEFVIVLPDCSAENALKRAEHLREAVKRLELVYRKVPLGRITASLGVAVYPDNASDPATLLRAVDVALYQAKERGRDRVVLSAAAGLMQHRVEPVLV